MEQFSRTKLLIGEDGIDKLANARVAIFGVGGVGGYVCEALVRSGVGAFDIIDNDNVCMSNLNRQIIATRSSVGKSKVDVMRERMLDINPEVIVNARNCFFLPENSNEFPFEEYDYVVDAVDTVAAKLELVMKCQEYGVPIISSMGAGNKIEASAFKVSDIYSTKVCPLARVMRNELKKRGVKKLKVVYSEEKPITPDFKAANNSQTCDSSVEASGQENEASEYKAARRRSTPGSLAFVPSVAGLIIAGEVVKDLTSIKGQF